MYAYTSEYSMRFDSCSYTQPYSLPHSCSASITASTMTAPKTVRDSVALPLAEFSRAS